MAVVFSELSLKNWDQKSNFSIKRIVLRRVYPYICKNSVRLSLIVDPAFKQKIFFLI